MLTLMTQLSQDRPDENDTNENAYSASVAANSSTSMADPPKSSSAACFNYHSPVHIDWSPVESMNLLAGCVSQGHPKMTMQPSSSDNATTHLLSSSNGADASLTFDSKRVHSSVARSSSDMSDDCRPLKKRRVVENASTVDSTSSLGSASFRLSILHDEEHDNGYFQQPVAEPTFRLSSRFRSWL